MEDQETIIVTGSRVSCDGGGGPLGHPRVYLEMGGDDQIVCPYCSRRFVRAGSAAAGGETASGD
ncbi:MAG: zinc-finger domain-containing protein [Rhodospirillales bacterium]|nr:zinc-finger domain-containing protein [Rhodospirillales bacterium]